MGLASVHPLSVAPASFDAGSKIAIVETAGGSVGALTAVCARVLRVFEKIELGFCRPLHGSIMERISEHMAPQFEARGTR